MLTKDQKYALEYAIRRTKELSEEFQAHLDYETAHPDDDETAWETIQYEIVSCLERLTEVVPQLANDTYFTATVERLEEFNKNLAEKLGI